MTYRGEKMNSSHDELVRRCGHDLINHYAICKQVDAGVNGPYDDPETPVRNLAHLAVLTAIEILTYGQTQYKNVLADMGEQLLSLREQDGLYTMRMKAEKDDCNGVIGHAWLIEGLIYLNKVFPEKSQYIELATDLAQKHKFDEKLGLWHAPRGEYRIDFTFNHQLWYAATLAELVEVTHNQEYQRQIVICLDKLQDNFRVHGNGRVVHGISSQTDLKSKGKSFVKRVLDSSKEKFQMPSYAYKEEGYHIFNIMAFARLYRLYSKHPVFSGVKFKKMMHYTCSRELQEKLKSPRVDLDCSLKNNITDPEEKCVNIYGYLYNVPGFEMMYISAILMDYVQQSYAEQILEQQIQLTYDPDKQCFGMRCHDAHTVSYRLYEYYRYLEVIS